MALDIAASTLFGVGAAAVDLLVCYSMDKMVACASALLVFSVVALVGVVVTRLRS